MQYAGQIPTRPAIPAQVESAQYEREYDSAGRVVREFDSLRPTGVTKLSNGHYLVCSRYHNMIYEYDREGKQVGTRQVPGGTRGALFIERK